MGWGATRVSDDGAAVGTAVLVSASAFVGSTAVDGPQLGLGAALRYAPFVLTVWAGTYLVLLTWFARSRAGRPATAEQPPGGDPTGEPAPVLARPVPTRPDLVPGVVLVALLALMGLQVQLSDSRPPSACAGWLAEERSIANVSANIDLGPRTTSCSVYSVAIPWR